MKNRVPALRLRDVNAAPVRSEREHVVSWMTAARRARFHFGLERVVDWARELGKPLVVLEALRVGSCWASDRHHRLVLDRCGTTGTPSLAGLGTVRTMTTAGARRKLKLDAYHERWKE